MLHKALTTDAQVKMTDSGNGTLRFYVSSWNNWDRVRPIPERPVKGAFAPYLADFVKDGFVTLAHDWGLLPVASITDAGEDDFGVWVDSEFHGTTEAQTARTVVKERLARGKSVKTSMGYDERDRRFVEMDDPALRDQGITKGKELTSIYLWEASLVNVPANPNADVTGAKALIRPARKGATLAAVKSLYDDCGMEDWEAREILSVLLCYIRDQNLLAQADPAALTLVANQLRDASGVVATLLQSADTTSQSTAAKRAAPVARTPFSVEVAHAVAACGDLVKRAQRYQTTRQVKEGRTLSAATRGKLEPVPVSLRDLADVLDTLLTETALPTPTKAIDLQLLALARSRADATWLLAAAGFPV